MATKELTKPVNEVGIIGQMYEERKSKKVGVLESREPKYKTLMMRDAEGQTFNITFSTFKSNWRKYQGKEVVQSTAQKEEARQEEVIEAEKRENRTTSAKRELEDLGEKPTITKEDKVKAISALKVVIENAVNGVIPDAKVVKTSRNSVKTYYKNHLLFGAYVRLMENRYTFDTTTEIAEQIDTGDIEIEKLVNDAWHISTKFRFSQNDVDAMLNIFVSVLTEYVIEKYIKSEQIKAEKKAEKEAKKNAKNEENKEE